MHQRYVSYEYSLKLHFYVVRNWVYLIDTDRSHMHEPRVNFALIESNGFLYAFGCIEVAEKYDLSSNRWAEVLEGIKRMSRKRAGKY